MGPLKGEGKHSLEEKNLGGDEVTHQQAWTLPERCYRQ